MIIRDLTTFPRSLFTTGTLTGFDASGHVAEETKHAKWVYHFHRLTLLIVFSPQINSVVAARGIITSAIATGVLGFITTVLFLFCIPDLDTFFSLDAPQPFVQLYALALGKGPSIFMTIIAVLGLILVRIASRSFPHTHTHPIHYSSSHANVMRRPCIARRIPA